MSLSVLLMASCALAGPPGDVPRLYDAGRYGEALRKVRAYLRSHPRDPEGLYWRGELEDDAEEARDCYRRLLRSHPGHPSSSKARLRLAQYFYARGDYGAVLAGLKGSSDGPCLYIRGRALLALGRYGEARESFLRSLSAADGSEDSLKALLGLSDACFLGGLYGDALRYADEAMRVDGSGGWAPVTSKRISLYKERMRSLGGYVVQVGAFRGRGQAERLCDRIGKAGYRVRVEENKARMTTTSKADLVKEVATRIRRALERVKAAMMEMAFPMIVPFAMPSPSLETGQEWTIMKSGTNPNYPRMKPANSSEIWHDRPPKKPRGTCRAIWKKPSNN